MLQPTLPTFRLSRHDDAATGDAGATGAAGAADAATGTDAGAAAGGDKTFTQADLDKHIADRLARQKAQYADYDDLKTKASEWEKLQDAQKSELEREREARTKAEQTATEAINRAKTTALRSAVVAEAVKAGAVDADAVLALLPADAVTIADDGTVAGAAEAIKTLLEAKPYLKSTSDGRPRGDIDQGVRDGAPSDLRTADDSVFRAEMAKLGLRPRR